MGTFQHRAVVVTGLIDEGYAFGVHAAHALALRLYEPVHLAHLVGAVIPSQMNGYGSFLIAPDGSKEGWDTSDQSDQVRALFKDELRSSLRVEWVEISYGELAFAISDSSRGPGERVLDG